MAKRKLIIEILTNFAKQNHQALFGFFHSNDVRIKWEDMLEFLKLLEQSDAIFKLLGNEEVYQTWAKLEDGVNKTLDVMERLPAIVGGDYDRNPAPTDPGRGNPPTVIGDPQQPEPQGKK